MPLQSVQVYNLFRSKNFSDEEAELIAAAIDHKENLTTREDLWEIKSELKEDIAGVKGDIAAVRSELKEDIAEVREGMSRMESTLRNEISAVRSELKEDVSKIREDMVNMEGALRGDMVKMESSMIKWFMGTAFAMTGLLSGIVFAMLKFAH